MTELAADDIDETFVPRPRAEVSFVEVDNELVVAAPVGPLVSDAHWLDRTASIVWKAFDGVTPSVRSSTTSRPRSARIVTSCATTCSS